MELSVTILLTGFSVVFAVLLILIGVIKLYGTIIYNLQNRKKKTKKELVKVEREPEPAVPSAPAAVIDAADEVQDDALIAVISAAVYSVYAPSQVRIRSIRRSPARSSAWRAAGLRDNTDVF